MKKLTFLLAVAVVLAMVPGIINAQGSFKGYMATDYYFVMDHNDADLKGQNGFWFRRIYLTFNSNLTDDIKMRLRFEMNSADFESATLGANVKDAYLSAKLGGQDVMVGIMSTPTFGHTVEDTWGYRALEKTPLDLFKFASSRDFGIGLKGSLDKGGTVNYNLLFGNSSSNKGEANKGKRIYGAVAFKPADGFVIEAYGDYEYAAENNKSYVLQGFAAYTGDWGRIGLLYANRTFVNGTTHNLGLFSAFAVIQAGKSVELIGRVDMATTDDWKAKFKGSGIGYIPFADYAKPTFIIAALSFNVAKDIWLIPNLKYTTYAGSEFNDDVYANLTLWFKFK